MIKNIQELIDKYQVRKTYNQKTEFIEWLSEKSDELDYELKIDEYSKKGRNLIIGDVENSKVILTAHYDTQPNFFIPMFMGQNWIGFIISQLYVVVLIVAFMFLSTKFLVNLTGNYWAMFIPDIILIAFLIQMIFGVANKHTVNDNTSGVATLLWIMEDLSREDREKVCFVFFDQEEIGLIGSGKFKKKYKEVVNNKPLINFDCVVNGDNIGFIGKKAFRNSDYSRLLNESIEEIIGNNKKYFTGSALRYIYPSDQLYFKQGVGVAALKKLPVFGYYLSGIHNSRDTVFMEENIELLKDTIIDFIKKVS